MLKTIDNQTIYYEKHGQNKNTILILPGWGNTRKTFNYLINNLKEKYTIYILDYPGFGNSKIPNKTLTIYDYAKIINKLIKELNITNPVIISHSFGGRITSLLISKYKLKVKKLILIDVSGIKTKKSLKIYFKEKLYKLLKKFIKLFPKRKRNYLKQKLLNLFASIDYKSLPNTMHETFKNIINEDLSIHYKNIYQETLILWGQKDQDTPLKNAYKLKKLISNSELIIFENASHYSYLNYPYLTLKIIEEFLK